VQRLGVGSANGLFIYIRVLEICGTSIFNSVQQT